MENEKKPKKRSLRLLSVLTVVLLLAFMAVPAFAAEGDFVIQAGTYRFNDVLTVPSADFTVDILFTASVVTDIYTGVFSLNRIRWFSNALFFSSDADGTQTDYYVYNDAWLTSNYGEGIQIIIIPNDTEVSAEFYIWFMQNAVPVNSFRDSVTSGLTVVIEWVGTVVSSLFSGELSGLLPIVAIPVAVTLLVLAIYFIRKSIWGA